jgi:hypothetical protein
LTAAIRPGKPYRKRLPRMFETKLGFGEAPTTATERGRNIRSRLTSNVKPAQR